MQRYHNGPQLNPGRAWVNLFSRLLTHLSLVLACVLLVLFFCELGSRGVMGFLQSRYAMYLILALCGCVILNVPIQFTCLYKLRCEIRYQKLKEKSER